jgi:hypothetical protein
MKGLFSTLLVAVVLAGCSSSVSSSPTASSPIQSGGPPDMASASAAVATQPAPTVSLTPASGGDPIEWSAPVAIDEVPFEYAFDARPGKFVVAANTDLWVSADGVRWDQHSLLKQEYVTLNDVAIGPRGIVAVGDEGIVAADNTTVGFRAVVLWSVDGEVWNRIEDPGFEDGQMRLVGATPQGFVAFGSDFRGNAAIWTSPDGRDWLRATNETGLDVARGVRLLIQGDGRLTAIVGPPGDGYADASEFAVWQTEGRAEWKRTGTLSGGGGGVLRGAYGGGRGLVVGYERAWTSADGVQWDVAVHPRGDRPAEISDVATFPGGYVAVGWTGSSPGDTCGGNEPWIGRTWTSADGREWHEEETFEGAAISRLVPLDGSIVGLGLSMTEPGEIASVMWTAPLPASLGGPRPTPAPTPSPTPAPSSDGCGG